jgi:hypothetical protein
MFHRLVTDHWQTALAAILFLLTFAGFVCAVVWAVRLKSDRVQRLAHLPLDGEASSKPRSV